MPHYAGGMRWIERWWNVEVVDAGKGPLLLLLVAFILTFVATRTITRLIRAGRGPFHNISHGGTHLHHSTPGIVLLVAGAFTSVGANGRDPYTYLAAVLIGVGASLVLDEFAMIFHLQDVYWSQEGQLSISVVTLSAACLGLALVGMSPANAPGLSGAAATVRGGLTGLLIIHLVCTVITALKGKYPTALVSIFVLPVALIAACRMARPGSPWARRLYRGGRASKAKRRAESFDARWAPIRAKWDDLIGGTPSLPNPTATKQ